MAYTTLVAGTTITASWANASVRDQCVSPFADSSARSSAISAPVNGMISVLTTTDRVDIYNGASWSALVAPSNGALTTFTPTLTQSATVTKTVTVASYIRVGRWVMGNVRLDVTGSGTASNNVVVGLPVTAATSTASIGSGWISDNSASLQYPGVLQQNSTTTALLVASVPSSGFLGTSSFSAGLASPDVVLYSFAYEAATDA